MKAFQEFQPAAQVSSETRLALIRRCWLDCRVRSPCVVGTRRSQSTIPWKDSSLNPLRAGGLSLKQRSIFHIVTARL